MVSLKSKTPDQLVSQYKFKIKKSKPPRLVSGKEAKVRLSIYNPLSKTIRIKEGVGSASYKSESGKVIFKHIKEFAITLNGNSQTDFDFEFIPETAGEWQFEIFASNSSCKPVFRNTLNIYWEYPPADIIGRTDEINKIKRFINPAISPNEQIMELRGDAGVGKTRLLDSAAETARDSGYLVLLAHCEENSRSIPFYNLKSLISSGKGASNLRSVKKQKLDAIEKDIERVFLETKDNNKSTYIKWVQIKAAELLKQLNKALMILIDDVQWLDTATSDFLTFLLREPKQVSKIIATYRPESSSLTLGEKTNFAAYRLNTKQPSKEIQIDNLNEKQTNDLITSMLGGLQVSENLVKKIYDYSEGLPLLIVDSIQTLRVDGALVIKDRSWELLNDLKDMPLPTSFLQVISIRFENLSKEHQRILELASIIGRNFSISWLADICDCGESDLNSALDAFEQQRLVHKDKASGEGRFSFYHKKYQEEIYKNIKSTTKTKLHLKWAEILQKRFHSELTEISALIAYHLIKAERSLEAVFWLYRSATKQQWIAQTTDETKDLYSNALEILYNHKEIQEVLTISIIVKLRYAEFLIPIKDNEKEKAGNLFREVLTDLDKEKPIDLAEENYSGEEQEDSNYIYELQSRFTTIGSELSNIWASEISLTRRQIEGRCHLGLGKLAQHRNDLVEAESEYNEALKYLPDDDLGWGEAMEGLAWIDHDKGDLIKSLRLFEQAAKLFSNNDQKSLEAKVRIHKGRILFLLGKLDEAKNTILSSREISNEVKDWHTLAYANNHLGEILRVSGQWHEALKAYEESERLFKRYYHVSVFFPISNQAKLYCQMGKWRKAEETAQKGYQLAEAVNPHCAGVAITTLAHLYWITDSDKCDRTIKKAVEITKKLKNPAGRARLLQIRISVSQGNLMDVGSKLRLVFDEFTREGDLFYQIMTELVMCQIENNKESSFQILQNLQKKVDNPFAWLRIRVHLLTARFFFGKEDIPKYKHAMKKMVEESLDYESYTAELAKTVEKDGCYSQSAERILRMM